MRVSDFVRLTERMFHQYRKENPLCTGSLLLLPRTTPLTPRSIANGIIALELLT